MNVEKIKSATRVVYTALMFELMGCGVINRRMHDALFHPESATFNITDNCNSRCITCNAWKQNSVNELSTGEVIDILGQLKDLGISNVGFAGGEPLLRDDLPELVHKSRETGFANVSIITNGILLNEGKIITLVESGVTAIGISIDGIGQTHEMIRGIKGSYVKSVDTLGRLVDLRDRRYPKLDIWVSTTLMKPNMHQIKKIIIMCDQLGVRLFLNLLDTSPYFLSKIDASNLIIGDQEELDELIDEMHVLKKSYPSVLTEFHTAIEYARGHFIDPRREDIPCCMGYKRIYIGAHGQVYPGCWVLNPVGSLRENKLDEIVDTSDYRRRLYDMFLKKCPGCACGYPTNLLYHIPSIMKEAYLRIKMR